MQTNKQYTTAQSIIINIAGLLIMLPLAPFICRFIPPVILGGVNIDLIISVIISIIMVRLLITLVRPMVIPALILVIGFLILNEISGRYGFTNVYNDYTTLAYKTWKVREEKQSDLLSVSPSIFEDEAGKVTRLVKEKLQYKDSVVRNFSVRHSLDFFEGYETKYNMLPRYLSLFKYINGNFKYVPDAQRDEYYATPRETILNGMGGDCDDHSILMAASLMSIGAKCRLVIIEGHMYPEMYVGEKKDFDVLQQAIIQLFSDERIDRIYYHENKGSYWINLDYTAQHPGGHYLSEKVKLLINL